MFGIGAVTRMFGLDLGKVAGNAVNNLLGNSAAGNIAGAVAQGLTSFLGADPVGMFQAAMNAFKSIGNLFRPNTGLPGMFGPPNGGVAMGRLPMLPQMGAPVSMGAQPMGGMGFPSMGGFGMPSMMGFDPSMGGAASALGQMKSLRGQMQALIGNKNMSPEDKQLAMMQLQQQMQTVQQLLQMISNVMKNQHQTAMQIIGNLR